jgi:hypothetical protein
MYRGREHQAAGAAARRRRDDAAMADYSTRIHEATSKIILTAIRRGREAEGLEAITAMRWRDESGYSGQDSHVRLALHVERGGEIFIEHDGETVRVEVEPDDRFLHTHGIDDESADPILQLPTY